MSAPTFSIGELAQEFELTTRAIRFYEDIGLLKPERVGTAGRQRVYSGRDRTRLRLTLRAKRLGLSLTEAREILDMYDSPRDTVPQLQKFIGVLGGHRARLEAQLDELQANLDEVRLHEQEALALLAQVSAAPDPQAAAAKTAVAGERRRATAARRGTLPASDRSASPGSR
ncbi:MAG: MerR family DNA-binding transcriptional regulator [Comamonadaceae bacterium]|nr:MAG: MerR family DNA-binding transcriptional regulator [Comamonadaceae bacterium]